MAKKYKVEYKLVHLGEGYKSIQQVTKIVEGNYNLDIFLKDILLNQALEYVAVAEIKNSQQILAEAVKELI